MKDMKWYGWLASLFLVVGGLNWGLGIWDVNLVTMLFGVGTTMTKVVYGLVGVSAIYAIFMWFMD